MSNNNTTATAASTDLVSFKILTNNTTLSSGYRILSIDVSRCYNKIAAAKINIADGDPAKQDFSISSNDDSLLPGNEIEIQMGYHAKVKTVFKGVIIKQSLRSNKNKIGYLSIEARDRAVKLSSARKNHCYVEMTDAEIIESIAKNNGFAGAALDIAQTALKHAEMVQYNTTDWDFIVSRAEMNSMLILTNDNKLILQQPDITQDPVKELTYGVDVLEFETEADSRSAIDSVKSYSWNAKDQEVLASATGETGFKDPAITCVTTDADLLGLKDHDLFHAGSLNKEELQTWSNARLLKSRLAKRIGRIKVKGRTDIVPGNAIKLNGFGKRFNGKVYVTGIRHNYDKSIWETDIQYGFPEDWFYERGDIIEKPASGLVPGINGLHIATVVQLENDPDGEGRIKIRLPLVDQNEGIWARVASLDAGNERGVFFRPEIQDEVVVGFLGGDPRHAIVLGMLHSSSRPSAIQLKDTNHEKGFVTRSKMKFLFNDEKKSISMETPQGKQFMVDEERDEITLADQHNNKITMNASGITIESARDISLKTGSGNITIEGVSISLSAKATFSAEGNAGARLNSSGVTVVKGSMVNIN